MFEYQTAAIYHSYLYESSVHLILFITKMLHHSNSMGNEKRNWKLHLSEKNRIIYDLIRSVMDWLTFKCETKGKTGFSIEFECVNHLDEAAIMERFEIFLNWINSNPATSMTLPLKSFDYLRSASIKIGFIFAFIGTGALSNESSGDLCQFFGELNVTAINHLCTYN